MTIANILANAVDPFLFGAWFSLVVPGFAPNPRWKFVMFSAIGLAVSVGIAEVSKAHSLWPGNSGFPSGHETFGASVSAALCRAHSRWIPWTVVSCAALGWALIACGYHRLEDVIGAWILGSGVTTAVLAVGMPRARRRTT